MKPGDEIGARFVLAERIGAGGMGQVFRALDSLTGEAVALKVIFGSTELDHMRFVREAAALGRVSHPAVVGYVDHGVTPDGRGFLAMKWLEGEDLLARLRRAPLSLGEAIALGRRVAGALGALHGAGVLHRDLKPANLLLVDGDPSRVVLLDLGVARVSHTRFGLTAMTAPGELVGTPAYAAPEQVRGRSVDARTDLYSLGVVLWECVARDRAFGAEDVMAVLTRVLFDPLGRLDERVADLPTSLADLVAEMTDKDPDARPASADEVAARLDAIEAEAAQLDVIEGGRAAGRMSVLSPLERRVVTVVVATPADAASVASETTWLPSEAHAALERYRPLAERHDLRVEAFPDGTIIALVDATRSPTDGVRRAARFALAVRAGATGAQVVLATGRVVALSLPVGEAVERASSLLERADREHVFIDEASAELLGAAFAIEPIDGLLRLGSEREGGRERALPARRCEGRARELALLRATLEECADEPCARAVLLVAEPGLGKTRLVDELLRDGPRALAVLRGSADPVGQGTPYAMIAPALRAWLGVERVERIDEARHAIEAFARGRFAEDAPRMGAILGELAGVPSAAPELAALRQDPRVYGDLSRAALVEVIAASTLERPVLFVLEDLQWADRATVELADTCLRVLEARPLMVLVTARPEADARFGRLFEGRDASRLELSPLNRRASERLAAGLGPALDEAVLARVVERAEGNPFFVEELVRAATRGEELPGSVLASVEARLDTLDAEARLVLRAASVLGDRFWPSAVEALVGASRTRLDVRGWIGALCEVGLVRAVALGRRSEEHAFSQRLVREACYAMLTDEDRRRGHRNAAAWLEQQDAPDPESLAHHLEAADLRLEAAAHRLRAAQRALEADDLEAVLSHVCAIDGDADPALRAKARVVEGEARIWHGDKVAARAAALAALEVLDRDGTEWMDAVGVLLDAAGGLGRFEDVGPRVAELLAYEPREPAQRRPLAVALARACAPLLFLDRSDLAARVAQRAASIAVSLEIDPMLAARLADNRGMAAAASGDVVSAVEAFETSAAQYARAGAHRWAASQRVNVATKLLEVGAFERAREQVEAAIAHSDRSGEAYTSAFGRLIRGLALQLEGRLETALDVQREAAERLAAVGDARLESASRSALAEVFAALGRRDEAEAQAAAAVVLVRELVAPRAAALAVQARVALVFDDTALALALAEEATALSRLEPMLDRELYLAWVHALALRLRGRTDEAVARARAGWRSVEANALRIVEPELRRAFLERVPEHRGLAALLGVHARTS